MEIAERLKERFLSEVVDVREFRDQVFITLKRERIVDVCRFLKDEPEIQMDFLVDLCGVDYPDRGYRFEVIYNLFSMKFRHRIILKALIPEDDPTIDSVTPLWHTANWHEREVCDMFGIVFNGHPDLRRILMPEDWVGFPLRKDYPLTGREDREYKPYEELRELHKKDSEWNIVT